MILVVNVCSEKLHYYEFVKPVVDILEEGDFFVKHYNEVCDEDLDKCDKVIICGTSLKDEGYLSGDFGWLKDFEKPVLGICAGFQILGLVNGCNFGKSLEVGFFRESFARNFLGLEGEMEVYHLHNNYISEWGKDWDIFGEGEIVQAVKHKEREVYGVLFHPEVRQKNVIREFVYGN
jgi:anthranilate/para-aminobenzoate synthase component II